MSGSCENKTALVTGAAGNGMGRSIALTLAREGARVVVNYRTSADAGQAIADHLTDQGAEAIAIQADVFDAEACRYLVDQTREAFGAIDICVIGPGAGWHGEPPHTLDPRDGLADLRQEVAPLYYLMPLVLPGMYAAGWGRLIAIGLHPEELPPAFSYNAAKAARREAMALASREAWPHGVTVNTIAPSPVAPFESLAVAARMCQDSQAWSERSGPTPQDVAEMVAYLCSDAGRFVTGNTLRLMH